MIGDELRDLTHAAVDQFDSVAVVASRGWEPVADQLQIDTASPTAAVLVVGPAAAVVKHAARAHEEFAFVTPDALLAKRWQRTRPWRDDITLRLWDLGWSLMRVDRLLVPVYGATLEYVVGVARRTPDVVEAAEV